ncbi:flagellar export chaperone FlgN [Lacrimispora saccharolytica]|uniref:FlgN family protein n=1 Tax=Lacrimispora saccharolytica (strain ATCC 35040 / DSM 2544 / NRCC 2533 / WM1) TaxID=610130 RepID=D9R9Y2_LACSW|nr:flagellar export chaperone FlgN [Lacrimispora saccharolytica]ADL05954.1 FlgN family protein [[Clostridium] saccharolyticum WM1]QRV19916.1 flagellar export chaperone FlgN [Lacrimispora saccharolytica]
MNDFIAVIEDMIQLFQELIHIEQSKLEAAAKNRITHVEECMNQEQAAILKLRGLDKKRETCQEQLGYKNDTFQQILLKTSGAEHNQLKQLFDSLTYEVRLFQETNESARSMIEINLHMINKELNNSQKVKTKDKAKWEGLL